MPRVENVCGFISNRKGSFAYTRTNTRTQKVAQAFRDWFKQPPQTHTFVMDKKQKDPNMD